jgi:hypothetical protein
MAANPKIFSVQNWGNNAAKEYICFYDTEITAVSNFDVDIHCYPLKHAGNQEWVTTAACWRSL